VLGDRRPWTIVHCVDRTVCCCQFLRDLCRRVRSDVVLETRVLVSRRLEDKNESLGLLVLDHEVLVSRTFGLGLGLEEKVWQFSRLLQQVVILDGSERGTPWHFVRDNKSSLPF